jgi:mannose-6-phosphate isomerase-like protein (cupin superfamily)
MTGQRMQRLSDRLTGAMSGEGKMDEAGVSEAEPFDTKQLSEGLDVLAPDGSEIRLLVRTTRGSMVHGLLPPGQVSRAITHRTVDEVWYFASGQGQVWRKQGADESVVDVRPGTSLSIPVGTQFQFRTTSAEPLQFVMCTMPPWPGEQEAVRVSDYWPVPAGENVD